MFEIVAVAAAAVVVAVAESVLETLNSVTGVSVFQDCLKVTGKHRSYWSYLTVCCYPLGHPPG